MGPIETALVSVSDRSGLAGFVGYLVSRGVRILATGGTYAYLKQSGIECEEISTLTGRVDLLGGLVKTLHPAIHAGILADRDNTTHLQELSSLGWAKIDMVVANFYPLRATEPAKGLSFMDIGGPAMVRAAAKNFMSCVPVPHPSWYEPVAKELETNGTIGEELRWSLATDTVRRTCAYDARILDAVTGESDRGVGANTVSLALSKALDLRYGENPHQRGALYSATGDVIFEVMRGILSYNNILDIDCCLGQLGEFDGNSAVVVKHVGPCGVAEAEEPVDALDWAYSCDPMSAFGGVIGTSFTFNEECARLLAKRFVECIIAPRFDQAALGILAKKKKTRLVTMAPRERESMVLRSALGGILIQSSDDTLFVQDLKFVSGKTPDEAILQDLTFAWKVVKHVKSNAIVFAKDTRTLGIGAGQPSRIDAVKIAIRKAGESGHDLEGSVMASDGFFPFPDCIELAAQAGARAVIQPGGSIRDEEVIAGAQKLGITMALTSTRHFKH